MKEETNLLFADKVTRLSLIVSLLLIFVTFGYVGLMYQQLPPILPIFHQLPWGYDRLGQTYLIFLPVTLSFALGIVNTIIAWRIYEQAPFLSRVLCVSVSLLSLLSLIFTLRTILLVV